MQIESIPFSNTKSFSKLFLDYTERSVSLRPFVSVFPSTDEISGLTDQVNLSSASRQLLSDILKKQYEKANILDEGKLHLISSLKDANTFTVTTGHQLQLAGGPLFFTLKILTTIKLAEELSKKGDKKFIPVFWLASEDHDIAEIDNIMLFEKEISWKPEAEGTPLSGALSTKGLKEFFKEIFELIHGSANEELLKELLSSSYLDSCANDLSAATTRFVHRLFSDFPLLVIDSNDKELKRNFVPLLQKEVQSSFSYRAAVRTTNDLEAAGYKGQASVRELNLFYINGNNRERIDKTGTSFRTITSSKEWDVQSLVNEIDEHPERFSPNVILRPLYQQVILPNVAYIGGPAEVAYWLQLKGVFDEAGVLFPAVVQRNSVMLLEKKLTDKIEKLGLKVNDFFDEEEHLVKEFVESHSSVDLTDEKEAVARAFEPVIVKAFNTDPTLKPSAEAELKKILNSMDAFHSKLIRAEKHKQEQSINQIRKIKQKLFPGNSPMERQETIIPYLAKYGSTFLRDLYTNLSAVPHDFKVVILD